MECPNCELDLIFTNSTVYMPTLDIPKNMERGYQTYFSENTFYKEIKVFYGSQDLIWLKHLKFFICMNNMN